MSKHHKILLSVLKELPGDYDPWGDNIRWHDPEVVYPDCSGGCKFFYELKNRNGEPISLDWGVCANPKSHRVGLLTFEHQGCQQFEPMGKSK